MKISAIVRADNGGLGTLSALFAHGLGFHRTISLARIDGECYPERFGAGNRHAADCQITPELVDWVCQGADVLLSFETWYHDGVPAMAHALGVKTALVPMYECFPRDGFGLADTDLAICPHALCLAEMRDNTPGLKRAAKTLLAPPADVERITFRWRHRAETFVHHAGHAGPSDRNNTSKVIAAWKYVVSGARLVLRSQRELPGVGADDPRITVERGAPDNYWELWNLGSGDVYLHPHRWEGCGLPLYEALSAGMPVMTTRWWPFCDQDEGGRMKDENGRDSSVILHPSSFRSGWLPATSRQLAIGVAGRRREMILRPITVHDTTPQMIAAAIDRVYGCDLSEASREARTWAEAHSWRTMGPAWRGLFEDLVGGRPIGEGGRMKIV